MGLLLLVLYGLGITVGAGIYVLVGSAASRAGPYTPLAFMIAAVVMGLSAASFALESNYDFLEVHAWNGARWVMVKRYTGTVGPALTDEFVGRYFYLRLATDASVTRHGFEVAVEAAD